jgi:hypothetical protein
VSRLAFVNAGTTVARCVAALLDGIDLVIVAPPPEVSAGTVRQLRTNARTHGAVLVCTNPWPDEPASWPDVDLTLTVTGQHTFGLGQGRGRIRRRAITVRAKGRGAANRPSRPRLRCLPPHSSSATLSPTASVWTWRRSGGLSRQPDGTTQGFLKALAAIRVR